MSDHDINIDFEKSMPKYDTSIRFFNVKRIPQIDLSSKLPENNQSRNIFKNDLN